MRRLTIRPVMGLLICLCVVWNIYLYQQRKDIEASTPTPEQAYGKKPSGASPILAEHSLGKFGKLQVRQSGGEYFIEHLNIYGQGTTSMGRVCNDIFSHYEVSRDTPFPKENLTESLRDSVPIEATYTDSVYDRLYWYSLLDTYTPEQRAFKNKKIGTFYIKDKRFFFVARQCERIAESPYRRWQDDKALIACAILYARQQQIDQDRWFHYNQLMAPVREAEKKAKEDFFEWDIPHAESRGYLGQQRLIKP